MTLRFVYFLTYVACIFAPLLLGGGVAIFSDWRAQLALTLGIAWALVESSISSRQFARRWSDLAWVAAAVAGITGAFALVIFEYIHFPELVTRAEWVAIAGAVLAAAGLLVRFSAIKTLGEFFTHALKISENHRIVQQGLYRYLRHPSYSGFAMIALGVPLLFGAVQIFVLTLTGCALALVVRILLEERILLAHFGDEYREYASRTKRLIPFVW